MKKCLITILIILFIIAMWIPSVLAANTSVSLEGSTNVAPGATGTILIKISSNDTIGVISGKLEFDSNIKIQEEDVQGKNGWQVTYNALEKKFNAYKAKGDKSEEIIEINYKTGNQETTSKITMKEIEVVDINYESEFLSDVIKTIAIQQQNSGNNEEQNPGENEEQKPGNNEEQNPGENEEQKPGNNEEQNPGENEEQKPDNNDEQDPGEKEDNKKEPTKTTPTTITTKEPTKTTPATTANGTLPYAGIMSQIVFFVAIGIAGIIMVIAYLKYQKYKGV